MKTPDIKQNPHPKMRYELTLTVHDAPGPFDSVSSVVQYKVDNDRCVPLQAVSGATLPPHRSVPIALTRVSDNVYKGSLYADLLQDEDYYGLGVCHWTLVAATASLSNKEVIFSPDLFKTEILTQGSATRYFSKRQYASDKKEPIVSAGVLESEYRSFKPEWQEDMFSVTRSVKEAFQ